MFKKLIEELNFPRNTGIKVKINNKIITIKFQLILILGDNLGLNGILGFVEYFKGNNFCRVCKIFEKKEK